MNKSVSDNDYADILNSLNEIIAITNQRLVQSVVEITPIITSVVGESLLSLTACCEQLSKSSAVTVQKLLSTLNPIDTLNSTINELSVKTDELISAVEPVMGAQQPEIISDLKEQSQQIKKKSGPISYERIILFIQTLIMLLELMLTYYAFTKDQNHETARSTYEAQIYEECFQSMADVLDHLTQLDETILDRLETYNEQPESDQQQNLIDCD